MSGHVYTAIRCFFPGRTFVSRATWILVTTNPDFYNVLLAPITFSAPFHPPALVDTQLLPQVYHYT